MQKSSWVFCSSNVWRVVCTFPHGKRGSPKLFLFTQRCFVLDYGLSQSGVKRMQGPLSKFNRVFLFALALAATGCASKLPSRVEGLANNGQAYTEALRKVNNLALDQSLEFTADLLPMLPRSADTLSASTTEMRKRAALVRQYDAQLIALGDYFSSLEALAAGGQADAVEKAAGKLAEQLKGTELAVDKKALGGAGAAIALGMHGKAVEGALQRDADLIAQVLAVNEQLLDEQIRWVTLRDELGRTVRYRDEVEKPFLDDKKLGETWKKAWVAELKRPPVIAVLEEAKLANRSMQQAWAGILLGKGNFQALGRSLENLITKLKD